MIALHQLIEHVTRLHTVDWRFKVLHCWPDMVGNLHTKMRVERIEGTTIIIGVYDSHWMHELFILSRMIIKAINAKLDQPYVTAVRFVLSSTQQKKQLKSMPIKPFVIKQVLIKPHHERALTLLPESELRMAMKQYLIRCLQT